MAETTPHPDPLPPPITPLTAEDCGIYSPEAPWSVEDASDWQVMGCVLTLVALIFFAGLVIGALWL